MFRVYRYHRRICRMGRIRALVRTLYVYSPLP
jgi:hypothetical protein